MHYTECDGNADADMLDNVRRHAMPRLQQRLVDCRDGLSMLLGQRGMERVGAVGDVVDNLWGRYGVADADV